MRQLKITKTNPKKLLPSECAKGKIIVGISVKIKDPVYWRKGFSSLEDTIRLLDQTYRETKKSLKLME